MSWLLLLRVGDWSDTIRLQFTYEKAWWRRSLRCPYFLINLDFAVWSWHKDLLLLTLILFIVDVLTWNIVTELCSDKYHTVLRIGIRYGLDFVGVFDDTLAHLFVGRDLLRLSKVNEAFQSADSPLSIDGVVHDLVTSQVREALPRRWVVQSFVNACIAIECRLEIFL